MAIVEDYEVTPASCALAEGCALASGQRRILRFATNVVNQGRADFAPPNPPENFPNLYEYGRCHGHFHFSGFADFALFNASQVVSLGRKQAYCAEDSFRRFDGPDINCASTTTCDRQGLSRGYVDVYQSMLDCQFLDITDTVPGEYTLRQCTNQLATFPELSFENNCIYIPYTIPPRPATTAPPLTTAPQTTAPQKK